MSDKIYGFRLNKIPLLVILCSLFSGSIYAREGYAGFVEPIREATLSSVVQGRINIVNVDEGSPVKKGAILIELDQKGELLDIKRRKVILDDVSELTAAKVRMDTLQKDLESTRKLFESSRSISRDEVAKKEMDYLVAKSDVQGLENQELREQVEYEMSVEQLERRKIKAPFDGVVSELLLKEGEGCQPQEAILKIIDAKKCFLVCNIPAGKAQALTKGKKVTILLPVGSKTTEISAVVHFISPRVDPASGLQKIKILFDNTINVSPGVTGFLYLDKGDE